MLVTACAPTPDGAGVGAGPATPSTPADPLEGFRAQQLVFEECTGYAVTALDEEYFPQAPDAECARLEVPLDYADPAGGTASVAVVRIPARGESMGALVFNPGGPGAPGLLATMGVSVMLADSPLTERFDLVGFDPRGTGATRPAVDCWSADGTTAGDAVFAGLGSAAPELSETDTRALMERCADGTGGPEALAAVGTRTSAHDMDVLRAALGKERLTFLGQSYGTRLGTAYAEQYPGHVRAMILDGAFDPTLGQQDRLLTTYAGFQASFDALAAECASGPDCPLGEDPEGATASLQALLQPLAEEPVPALGEELTHELAVAGVIGGLYAPQTWPRVVEGLREVERGSGDTLLALARGSEGVEVGGDPSEDGTAEALLAINCVDEEPLSADEVAGFREATATVAPFMDPGRDVTDGARDRCADWPVTGQLGVPHAQDVEGLPPTLVVSITGDPATPHSGGVALARALGSTLLTVEGEGHTVVSSGASPCVDAVAAAYLIDLRVPEAGARCSLD